MNRTPDTRRETTVDASDRLLKVPEVVARLGVHPETVKLWLLHHKLPGRKMPGGWRVRAGTLEAWIDEHPMEEKRGRP